jgi:high affinity sulfate transporter 1
MKNAMNNHPDTHAGFKATLRAVLPVISWLPAYNTGLLKWDLIAGLTLASYLLPLSMAYATLAGLPPQYGIYCVLAGGFLFAFFSTSRQLSVGPTSAISLMIGTTVATMSGGDPQRWIEIASLSALTVAILFFIAYILRLSVMVNFVSESVLTGFKAGAALSIISTQLPKLFGIRVEGHNFFARINALLLNIGETDTLLLVFGLVALLVLVTGNRLFPGKPVALLVVIGSVLVVSFSPPGSFHLTLTGELPGGLPTFGKSTLRIADVEGIFGLSLACALMGYIETISAARIFAEKYNYRINPRQELLSLAMANAGSALNGGFVVSGGLSQTTVNDKAGAKTPMSLVICSLFLLILLLFFTGLLKNLPGIMLAVIVIDAVAGLVNLKSLQQLYKLSYVEFLVAITALIGVLWLGILQGVLLASLMSFLLLIKRATSPPVAVLGKIPGTTMYSDISRHPDNEMVPNLLILRIESSIFYFNESSIYDQIIDHLDDTERPVRWLVLDMSSSPYIDVAGSLMLMNLVRELKNRGIGLKISEALSEIRDLLRKVGMEEYTGHITRKYSLYEIIEELDDRGEKGQS